MGPNLLYLLLGMMLLLGIVSMILCLAVDGASFGEESDSLAPPVRVPVAIDDLDAVTTIIVT